MVVLSLFDGMRCGYMALNRAGIPVTEYYASEVNKYTIKVGDSLFPGAYNVGDIRYLNVSMLPKIDLVFGGSPCQGFSLAGKQLAFDDPRSALFFEFLRVLKAVLARNPKARFLLENVRMKKEYLDRITEMLGTTPICINSALVSAQNRTRYYWTNIQGVNQPEDRGVLLGDIIEHGVVDRFKSFCLTASYCKGTSLKRYFEKNQNQVVFALAAMHPWVKSLSINSEGVKPLLGGSSEWGRACLGRMAFVSSKKTRTLIAKQVPKLIDPRGYRMLTVRECGRLQTVPENALDKMLSCGVSNTQLYRMLGNGWTVDVIAHIFRGLRPKVGGPSP